jgi:hypothetical protein
MAQCGSPKRRIATALSVQSEFILLKKEQRNFHREDNDSSDTIECQNADKGCHLHTVHINIIWVLINCSKQSFLMNIGL